MSLVATPPITPGSSRGLTIKDRLRVLQPNDPNSYYRYKERELLTSDMLDDMSRAKIAVKLPLAPSAPVRQGQHPQPCR